MSSTGNLYAVRNWYIIPIFGVKIGTSECQCGNPRCVNVGKHPQSALVPNGLLNATTDTEVIAGWFRKDPTINVGLALPLNQLIAIDVDVYKGDKERLDALESQLGALPKTLVQLSGSGEGYHLIYKAPTYPIKGSLGGITMRGRNYIVIAPSVHKSGKQYQWVDEREPVELPDAWLEALRKTTALDGTGVPATDPEWLPVDSERVAAATAYLQSQEGETYQVSPSGTTWNVIRSTVRGYGLRDADVAYQLIQTYYNARCSPPWADDRLAEKINKAYSEAELPEWGSHLKPLAVSLTEIGIKADHPQELDGDAKLLAEALQDIQHYNNNQTSTGKIELLYEHAPTLFTRDLPSVQWLVQGLISEGGLANITTAPKAAKTWLATELAIAIATGTPALGQFPTAQGKVAYFYAEDLASAIRNRLRALSKSRRMDPQVATANLHVQPRGRSLDVTKQSDLAMIIASTRKIGPVKLLVLDPMREIHRAKENDNDGMSLVMGNLKMLGTLLGCTVLFIHHNKKSSEGDKEGARGGEKMRGASSVWGAIDSAIYLDGLSGNGENEFTNRVETVVKGAKSAGFFSLTLTITDGEDGTAECANWSVTKTATSVGNGINAVERKINEIVDALGIGSVPLSVRQLQQKVRGSYTTLCTAVMQCEKRGLIAHPDGRAEGWVLTDFGKKHFANGSSVSSRIGEQG